MSEKSMWDSKAVHRTGDTRKSEKMEKGKNINIAISFMRHGDKDSVGELSSFGYIEARELGKYKDVKKDGIKMYTSPFRRTENTVDAVLEGIGKQQRDNKVFKTRSRIMLAPPKWEYFGEIAKKSKEAEEKDGHSGVFRYLMKEPLAQKDLEHWSSSLAYMIDRYRKAGSRFYSGSEVELSHVTHDMVIGYFLRKVAIFRDEEGNRIENVDFDHIGGPMNFLEGFKFDVKLDENANESSKIIFRGKVLEVDENKFREMVNYFKSNPYKGRITSQNYKEKA